MHRGRDRQPHCILRIKGHVWVPDYPKETVTWQAEAAIHTFVASALVENRETAGEGGALQDLEQRENKHR
jgi:hypothetical protein